MPYARRICAFFLTLGMGCAAIEDDPGAHQAVGGGWQNQGAAATGGHGQAGHAPGGAGGGGNNVVVAETCEVAFAFSPKFSLANPRIAGAWHDFQLSTATPLLDDGSGTYRATLTLPPGQHAYKLVYEVDGKTQWVLDPDAPRRRYHQGTENSALRVADCNLPTLSVQGSEVSRPSPGAGRYRATLAYLDDVAASGPQPAAFTGTVSTAGKSRALSASELVIAQNGAVSVDIGGLSDGKHTVRLQPADRNGTLGETQRLVFWVEAETFSWKDALVYMVVTDRYRDGDSNNNAAAIGGVLPAVDWQGGDLEGVRKSIADGSLDALGIRAIWLTPFQTGASGGFLASDGTHQVSGYHGYWPIKAREVDARLGGEAALHALVKEAHAHGIRILMDFVINHAHEDHEYRTAHPDWFRSGCVCGTANCDWTAHALDCSFASYLPDIDHRNPEAGDAYVDDALWWLDNFDLDGLRIDAVKHVEESATRNVAAAVRDTFEAAGTRYFLMGETAMGWSDCADPCNDNNYDTIARYLGPHGLDGQFDFVLYHATAYRTFAYGDQGMQHADYWLSHGLARWPADAIMTPFIGSHDSPRLASLANYRGQDGAHARHIPSQQWDNIAGAPSDAEPYRRMRIAMSWLLTIPGAPLLYYGDEYGQWGGADPNNRVMWRSPSALNGDEAATLAHVRKIGKARQLLPALRRGSYQSLGATDDTLVFARPLSGAPPTIVALTRNAAGDSRRVEVNNALGLGPGTTLHDALGGPDVVVAGDGHLTIAIPSSSVVILTP